MRACIQGEQASGCAVACGSGQKLQLPKELFWLVNYIVKHGMDFVSLFCFVLLYLTLCTQIVL